MVGFLKIIWAMAQFEFTDTDLLQPAYSEERLFDAVMPSSRVWQDFLAVLEPLEELKTSRLGCYAHFEPSKTLDFEKLLLSPCWMCLCFATTCLQGTE